MKSIFRSESAVIAACCLLITGCAQPVADTTYTIRAIESSRGSDGTVRVKLSTPGDVAEADEDLLVNFVQVVAIHEATKRQRQVAEERARATYRKMKAKANGKPGKARYLAVVTEKEPEQEKVVQQRVAKTAKTTTKVATAVPKDTTTTPKAPAPIKKVTKTKSIMIWDTQSESIVGNNVYDVEITPPVGTVARFETYSAEYIGSGN